FSKKKKVFSKILFYLLVIILGLLAMVFAESEGALLGAGGGIVFILLARVLAERLRDKEINFKRKLIILLILIISLLAISQFKTYIIEKATLSDHSGQIRQQMWRETWQMLTDGREITGAGLANYQNSIEKYHQSGIYIRNDDPDFDEKIRISLEYQQANWQPIEIYLYPHNIILNFWSEIGMFGLLVFILLNLKMLLNYRKVKNAENKEFYFVLIAVLLAIWVHGLVDVPYFKNDLSVFFWLIFGMSVVLARSRKSLE
ncbi:O-antigen ligase family protein, partial [Patescibacteria group bacterium]|nr:O-antigen ligase family protein [Patescibacteria group bacterium]